MTEAPTSPPEPQADRPARAQEIINEANKVLEDAATAREEACAAELESAEKAILEKYQCFKESTMTATVRGNVFRHHVIAIPSP